MSRLTELKKQYPHLNLSLFDLMVRMDISKTYKYLPLFCKILNNKIHERSSKSGLLNEYKEILKIKSVKHDDLNNLQIISLGMIAEFLNQDECNLFNDFMVYMEKNRIKNTDITSYSNIDELRGAVSLASLGELNDNLSKQVYREYEDDTWLMIRPLTFSSSSKYGASTRWCTTYESDKAYFHRYWSQGILIYFINKKTGYKFAGYKCLVDDEFGFWSAADYRVEFITLDIDDYLLPIVKSVFKSKETNRDKTPEDIRLKVDEECLPQKETVNLEVNLATVPVLGRG